MIGIDCSKAKPKTLTLIAAMPADIATLAYAPAKNPLPAVARVTVRLSLAISALNS